MKSRVIKMAACALLFIARPVLGDTNWTTITGCRFLDSKYYDADSFHVVCGGDEKIFRLYFVDAPETDFRFGRLYRQSEYFAASEEYVLEIGKEATSYVSALLTNTLTIHTKWARAGGQSRLPRFYAVVDVDGRDLAALLVENGFARVFGARTTYPDGTKSKDVELNLRTLEDRARRNRVGIWSASSNTVERTAR